MYQNITNLCNLFLDICFLSVNLLSFSVYDGLYCGFGHSAGNLVA
uniref:Uncharacterized protein n=1 Tax=Rhizophora mucronata TaxID=61149 RepID=A0A2P2QNQ4_RHIMU